MKAAKVLHRGIDYETINFPSGYRERVFADLWQEYNNCSPGVLKTICKNNNLGKMTQQDAAVAATLIQWLGTNGGNRFLSSVEAAMTKGLPLPQTFLDLWVKENASLLTGCQHGLLAMLLIPAEKLSGLMYLGRDPVSARDIKIVNALMVWLGSQEGQLFLSQVQQ